VCGAGETGASGVSASGVSTGGVSTGGVTSGGTCVCGVVGGVVGGVLVLVKDVLDLSLDLLHGSRHVDCLFVCLVMGYLGGVLVKC
jgi:hypothetical protein